MGSYHTNLLLNDSKCHYNDGRQVSAIPVGSSMHQQVARIINTGRSTFVRTSRLTSRTIEDKRNTETPSGCKTYTRSAEKNVSTARCPQVRWHDEVIWRAPFCNGMVSSE
jgi:hypothetical protein